MKPSFDDVFFTRIGGEIINRDGIASETTRERNFSAFFGTTATVCVTLWALAEVEDSSTKPVHLLWGLMLMNLYASESVLCTLTGGVDEKTFRKWSWIWITAVGALSDTVVSSE